MQEYLIPECSAVMILKLKLILITSTMTCILCDNKWCKVQTLLFGDNINVLRGSYGKNIAV